MSKNWTDNCPSGIYDQCDTEGEPVEHVTAQQLAKDKYDQVLYVTESGKEGFVNWLDRMKYFSFKQLIILLMVFGLIALFVLSGKLFSSGGNLKIISS